MILSNDTSNIKILMCPWIENHEHIMMELQADDSDYLFGHFDINGVKQNRYTKVHEGVQPNVFSRYKKVYSGHIHIRQTMGNIHYVGAPYQMDRGDIGNDRGYHILYPVNGKLDEKFFMNEYSPRFIECEASDLFEKSASEVACILNNNYIDININVSLARFINMDVLTKYFKDNNIRPRRFEFIPYKIDDVTNELEHVEIEKGLSIISMGNLFINSTKMYNEAETENIMNYFSDLYTRAKNQIA